MIPSPLRTMHSVDGTITTAPVNPTAYFDAALSSIHRNIYTLANTNQIVNKASSNTARYLRKIEWINPHHISDYDISVIQKNLSSLVKKHRTAIHYVQQYMSHTHLNSAEILHMNEMLSAQNASINALEKEKIYFASPLSQSMQQEAVETENAYDFLEREFNIREDYF